MMALTSWFGPRSLCRNTKIPKVAQCVRYDPLQLTLERRAVNCDVFFVLIKRYLHNRSMKTTFPGLMHHLLVTKAIYYFHETFFLPVNLMYSLKIENISSDTYQF